MSGSRARLAALVVLAVLAALAVAYLMSRGVLPVVLAGLVSGPPG